MKGRWHLQPSQFNVQGGHMNSPSWVESTVSGWGWSSGQEFGALGPGWAGSDARPPSGKPGAFPPAEISCDGSLLLIPLGTSWKSTEFADLISICCLGLHGFRECSLDQSGVEIPISPESTEILGGKERYIRLKNRVMSDFPNSTFLIPGGVSPVLRDLGRRTTIESF